MDNQTVKGIAHADATGLGITNNRLTHFKVGIPVIIGVDHSGTRFYHRNTCGVPDEVYQSASASWDAEIYIAYGIQHLACCLMGGWQQGDHVRIDTKALQYFMNQFY